MKKTIFVLSSILFFFVFLFGVKIYSTNKTFSVCNQNCYSFDFNGQKFMFNSNELKNEYNFSKKRKLLMDEYDFCEAFKMLKNMGLSSKEIIDYLHPECELILNKLKNSINTDPVSNEIKVEKNSCNIVFQNGKRGRYLNELDFYRNFEKALNQHQKKISFSLSVCEFENNKFDKNNFKEKSCFSTNFSTSNDARKNNIKKALSSFDGLILEEGEILSFNNITGVRNQQNGYQSAKIISGGTFVEGFGGGVCQVSTTLYNACLLAGLEIIEVNSHSLPVSYVEPSFDAMVNIGSSDLVVRNNSGGTLIFTTSSKNDICKVKIFGKQNQYKITRQSERVKMIPAEKDEIVTDFKKYKNLNLEIGEQKRISFAKDGFYSNGYLNFYDKNGNLIKTQKIRSNKYNPTKGVIVKREK